MDIILQKNHFLYEEVELIQLTYMKSKNMNSNYLKMGNQLEYI